MKNLKKGVLGVFVAILIIFGNILSVKAVEDNNETINNLIKINETKLNIPNMFVFSPDQYFNSSLKIAFIELEALNSIGVEITKENMEPFFFELKQYIDETSNGKTIVDPEYYVLEKKVVPVPINGAWDINMSSIVDELVEKYGTEYEGYSLVIIADAPYSMMPMGANYDHYEKIHPVVITIGNFFNGSLFNYVVAHEILHSFNKAKLLILDGYYAYDKSRIPWMNSIRYGLFGKYNSKVHPFGPSKVKLGWMDYNVVNYQMNSPISITLENSCSSPTINKIPLGYVKSPENKILLKSLLLELRGFSDCGSDRFPAPGVHVNYIYEDIDLMVYSHTFKEPGNNLPYYFDIPYYFALEKTNYYYKEDGSIYWLDSYNEQYRLTEFADSDFSIKLLSENWTSSTDRNRLTSNDRLISADVEIVIKTVPNDTEIKKLNIDLEFYDYKNSAIIIKANKSLDFPLEILTSNTSSQNARFPVNNNVIYYCFFDKDKSNFSNIYDQIVLCDEIVKNNLTEEEGDININTYLIENKDENINFTAGNSIVKKEITMSNPFIVSNQSSCPDLNSDGKVNYIDLGIITSILNTCSGDTGYNAKNDINGDNCINQKDVDIINTQYGQATTCAQASSCPDIDANGIVDYRDLGRVGSAINTCSGNASYNSTFDLNEDNCVNNGELLIIEKYYNFLSDNIPICISLKTINLDSPNGSEIWTRGNNYDITWNIFGTNEINIGISTRGKDLGMIAMNVDTIIEKYTWTIPKEFGLGFNDSDTILVKIRLEDSSNPNIYDESDNYFSIVSQDQELVVPMLEDGSIIRAENDVDVYIIKYSGNKKFKRLILNPSVFESYEHLNWDDIITVSQDVMNEYTTSSLVRVDIDSDQKVYALAPNGDVGLKSWINLTVTQFIDEAGSDVDSIYVINLIDSENYTTVSDITTVGELIIFYSTGNLPGMIEVTCRTDFDCDDSNIYTIDTCLRPDTPDSSCEYAHP